jgi:pimeloyl-ACP methyl ester carboxylesterase
MDAGQRNGDVRSTNNRGASIWRVGAAQVELEVFSRGSDAADPLLVVHDLDYLNGVEYPFIERLAARWRVLAPSHPGFGGSSLPPNCDSVDDLAYVYLDLLREIGPAHVVGLGFGGWIAAELAVRCAHDVRSLVLVDALGIKVGDRTTADIADMFVVSPAELVALSWHDAARGKLEMPLPVAERGASEDEVTMLLENRRAAALFGWKPFMHHEKLRGRLARIDRPTLVVWGASDGIVSAAYGRAYAASIPGARFELIGEAGHYPYLERPAEFLDVVEPFLVGESHS